MRYQSFFVRLTGAVVFIMLCLVCVQPQTAQDAVGSVWAYGFGCKPVLMRSLNTYHTRLPGETGQGLGILKFIQTLSQSE